MTLRILPVTMDTADLVELFVKHPRPWRRSWLGVRDANDKAIAEGETSDATMHDAAEELFVAVVNAIQLDDDDAETCIANASDSSSASAVGARNAYDILVKRREKP